VTDTSTDPSADDLLLGLMQDAFRGVPLHDLVGIDLKAVGGGRAVVEIPLSGGALSSFGALHGGAVGVLVDVVSAAAASTSPALDHATSTLVTSDLHVRYLGRARGDHVRAEARVVKAGRSLVVVDTEVVDSEGTLVATADVAMSIVPHRA
jgi:uncharacterized protein (TIGR00369 family)